MSSLNPELSIDNVKLRRKSESFSSNAYPDKEEAGHLNLSINYALLDMGQKSGIRFYTIAKRLFDFFATFVALILLSPIMLLIALLVKINDGGPAIYSQIRVGKDGKKFKIYKFRSMCLDADKELEKLMKYNEMDGNAFKMTNDPRITSIGRFLRATSLDELPQLFNVLKGEMSLVGPRPPLVSEVENYNERHKLRLAVTPGLTCYWQCSGRSNIGFEQWVDMDIDYINKQSFLTDLKILFKTVPAVLSREGAR